MRPHYGWEMAMSLLRASTYTVLITICGLTGGCSGSGNEVEGQNGALGHTLFVAHEGSLVSYDIATGEERPGAVQDVTGPVDLQALSDGTLMVNLTGRNEILLVDGRTMLEVARVPSSAMGGKRPVHSYISPEQGGEMYWLTLNDGENNVLSTNTARFLDITPGSATYQKPVGEVALGAGHHKASFSTTTSRVVISNIADCEDVLTVYDYSDVSKIVALATLSAKDAGFDGSTYETTCDPTYMMGAPPSPHGCATDKVSGKAYCNLTTSGAIVAVDIDATPPSFKVIPTGGSGSGYTKAHPDGRYVYSVQDSPREGHMKTPGATCQIGQLVVIDATTDAVVKELPLFYKGPDCKDAIVGTDEETAEPSHIQVAADGKTLFITTAGGFGVESARVRQELVLDISDPKEPVELASIAVGASSGHHGDALTGDGKYLFVANNVDGTVTQIDAGTRAVLRTLAVKAQPKTLATFGEAEGPSVPTGPIH
jgi:YVTN family beta-propeller protein